MAREMRADGLVATGNMSTIRQGAYEPVSQQTTQEYEDSTGTFRWNNRQCSGSEIHVAALHGDEVAARRSLAGLPDGQRQQIVRSRFTYETMFQGKSQEGSGEALHLAASRGHVNVAKLLLEANADLTATVSRDRKPHYDVLHSAMFAEGRGGTREMISFLCEAKAEMTKNLDGKYPLHIAFQTGNVEVIQLLRTYMEKAGTSEKDYSSPKVPAPLMLGINGGKMSEAELSDAAELSTESLVTFIHECPQCVPMFFSRMDGDCHVSAKEVAKNLTPQDIATVFREDPNAALDLLNHVTTVPEIQDPGWHGLPRRVSFASRNWLQRVTFWCNPPRRYITHYEQEVFWSFDSKNFEGPEWHKVMMDRSPGRPIIDAEIKVCHVPHLLCAEVFGAISDPCNDDSLQLYENEVIDASIMHVFWNGCARADLTNVLLTFWGLALLIAEEFYVHAYREEGDSGDTSGFGIGNARGRHLKAAGAGTMGQGGLSFNFVSSKKSTWIAISWLAARGFSDLVQEYVQLRGFVCIGRWRDYFSIGNFGDTFFSCLPMLLLFDSESTEVMIVAVFLYWSRLLDCFTSAEYIGLEILPIKSLMGGLAPSLLVTAVAFGAFTHASYLANGSSDVLWPNTILDSFSVLITAGLPSDPEGVTNLQLSLVLFAVLFFSVFILNIFIGVLSELYVQKKEEAPLAFRRVRASSCFDFLLRSRVLPCQLCSRGTSIVISLLAAALAVGLQAFCFYDRSVRPWVFLVFLVCQLIILGSSYQDEKSPWAFKPGQVSDHYLWYCKRRQQE